MGRIATTATVTALALLVGLAVGAPTAFADDAARAERYGSGEAMRAGAGGNTFDGTLGPLQLLMNLRVRGELLADGDLGVGMRARMGFLWPLDDAFEVMFALQDVQLFGEFAPSSVGFNVDLFEAFLRWQMIDVLGLQLGRFQISYDQERMFGADDWQITGQRFTGARLRILGKDHTRAADEVSIDAFWLVVGLTVGITPLAINDQVFGSHIALPVLADHSLSVMLLHRDADSAVVRARTTSIGVAFERLVNSVVYDVEPVLQLTNIDTATPVGVALAVHAVAGWSQDGEWKLIGEFNLATADDPTTARDTGFNPQFGSGHEHFGYMDRQDWHNTMNGAVRFWYYLGLKNADQPIVFELSVWAFFRMGGTGSTDVFLGPLPPSASDFKALEVDFVVSHKFRAFFDGLFGVSIWIPGDLSRAAGVTRTDIFFYLQLDLHLP